MKRDVQADVIASGRASAMFRAGGIYIMLIAGGITMIFPFLWMISTSLKSFSSVFVFDMSKIQWIPHPVYWKNYVDVWKVVPFARFYINSVFVALCVTAGQVMTSAFAA